MDESEINFLYAKHLFLRLLREWAITDYQGYQKNSFSVAFGLLLATSLERYNWAYNYNFMEWPGVT